MTIYESIAGIMNEGAAVTKSKRNQQQGFQYRGIDDVMNTFQPLLAKYKVFVVPEIIDRQREERQTNKGATLIYSILTIRYTFYAEDGSSVSAVVVGEGMDSGDKASNKAMSVGMKYALFQTFCIPTEEMSDPDADTPPPSTPAKAAACTCQRCGKRIVPTKSSKGVKSVEEQLAFSRKAFGMDYCLSCSQDEFTKAKKAAENMKEEKESA